MSREEYLELKLMAFLVEQEIACEILFLPSVFKFEDSIIRPN